jgi:thiol-disulfide isomerase/thioredoxin
MRTFCRVLALIAVALVGCATPRQTAQPSQAAAKAKMDPAALDIAAWVKGGPVDVKALQGKQVVVVEFWATWCPPCRKSIPHLTDLQHRYQGKATFIGVSSEAADDVKAFVQKMGDKMDYTVAVDNNDATTKRFYDAYDVDTIPHAFIIGKSGKVVFHDNPLEPGFETALDKAVKE